MEQLQGAVESAVVVRMEVISSGKECSSVQVSAVVPEDNVGDIIASVNQNGGVVQGLADHESGKVLVFNLEWSNLEVVRGLVAEIGDVGEIQQVEHLGFGPTVGPRDGCA
ncbi:MAG: hypothetical protein AAGA23_13145 [Pseudomonadota bacterium]